MKNKIQNTLEALGFELKQMNEHFYMFKYEDIAFAWLPNEHDEFFLSLAIPFVMEKPEDSDELNYLTIMDVVNSTEMYIKANTFAGGMWLFYERELLDEDEDLERIIHHMIARLEGCFNRFQKAVDESDGKDKMPLFTDEEMLGESVEVDEPE